MSSARAYLPIDHVRQKVRDRPRPVDERRPRATSGTCGPWSTTSSTRRLWVPDLVAGRPSQRWATAYDGDRPRRGPGRRVGPIRQRRGRSPASRRSAEPDVPVDTSAARSRPEPVPTSADASWTPSIHGWDLARGIGIDDTIDADVRRPALRRRRSPREVEHEVVGRRIARAGPMPPTDADAATKLLAVLGRVQ